MFENFKAKRAAAQVQRAAAKAAKDAEIAKTKAANAFRQKMADWQTEYDAAQGLVKTATSLTPGTTTSDLVLKSDEALIGWINGASLIEIRSTGGHYVGGSTGVSIPIGSIGGRSVRYRVGRTSGHYEAGTPSPTAVDVGRFYISDQRMVFVGAKSSKECRYDKLVSLHHSNDDGELAIAVSNRQKNTVVHYGPKLGAIVDFWIDLALARFHGQADEFVAKLQANVDELAAQKPVADAVTPPALEKP